MCSNTCIEFVERTVLVPEILGKQVIESGAQDVNGSVRPCIERLGPKSYLGTDLQAGHRVDVICDAVDLVTRFGAESFDVVISTEQLEHVEDWRAVVSNFKQILKPGGILFITTRSEGFPYHAWPTDCWRYELIDMRAIFADMEILALESDPREPGVFIKARKPFDFQEKDLSHYALYSINTQHREVVNKESI